MVHFREYFYMHTYANECEKGRAAYKRTQPCCFWFVRWEIFCFLVMIIYGKYSLKQKKQGPWRLTYWTKNLLCRISTFIFRIKFATALSHLGITLNSCLSRFSMYSNKCISQFALWTAVFKMQARLPKYCECNWPTFSKHWLAWKIRREKTYLTL